MAFCKVLILALAFASASAAPSPQTIIRAVPFGSVPLGAVPLQGAVPLANHIGHHVVHQPVLPAVRAVAPAAVVEAETEIVDIDPSYRFGYSVSDTKTGDSKTREETRDGNVVTGSYTVADPDGRIRRVTYTADAEHGFNAVVTYDGEAGPPAIPILNAEPVPAEVAPVADVAPVAPVAPAASPIIQAVRDGRTVPASTVPLVRQQLVHANPTVVTHDATHRIHNAVVPHLVHQNVAPTATFLRNADGTISQVTNLNQFHGIQTVPLNSGFLRAFPSLQGHHFVHA